MADTSSPAPPPTSNLRQNLGKRWAWLFFIFFIAGISTLYAFQQEPDDDSGANSRWKAFSQPIERNAHLRQMEIAEDLPVLTQLADGRLMMLGAQGTVFSSKDEGKTWQVVAQTGDKPTGWKAGIAQLPDGRLAAIDDAGRVLMADVNGSNWQAIQVEAAGKEAEKVAEKSAPPSATPEPAKAPPAKKSKAPEKSTSTPRRPGPDANNSAGKVVTPTANAGPIEKSGPVPALNAPPPSFKVDAASKASAPVGQTNAPNIRQEAPPEIKQEVIKQESVPAKSSGLDERNNVVRPAALASNFGVPDFVSGLLPAAYAVDAKGLATGQSNVSPENNLSAASKQASTPPALPLERKAQMNSICATPQGALLAVGENGEFLLSNNAGVDWKLGQSSTKSFQIALCLSNGKMLAFGERGIFQINGDASSGRSRIDWGKNDDVFLMAGVQWFNAAYALSENNIVAAGKDGRMLTSQDGGKTWQEIPSKTILEIIGLAATKNNELVALVSFSNFMVKINAQNSWQTFTLPNTFYKTSRSLKTLVVTKQGRFLSSGVGGLVLSYDPQQQKWALLVPQYSPNVHSIVHSQNEVRAFSLSKERFFSMDDGGTWQTKPIGRESSFKQVYEVKGKALLTISRDGIIEPEVKIVDNWPVNPFAYDLGKLPPNLAFFRNLPDDELAAISTSGKWFSQKQPQPDWMEHPPITPAPVDLVALSDGRLLALPNTSGLMVSDTDRKQWQQIAEAKDIPFHAAITTSKKNTIAIGKQASIFGTSDAGKSWQKRRSSGENSGDTLRTIIELADGTLITAGDNGIYAYSTNDGQNWTFGKMPLAMRISALHQTDTGRVIAGAEAGMFFLSDDKGKTWQAITYQRYPAPWYWLLLGLCIVQLLWMTIKITVVPPEQPNSTQPERAIDLVISDRPVRNASEDRLGFAQVIAGVSKFIRNENTSLPLTFAVTGEWGRGKSSMMEMLKNDLQQHRFRCMWFNPWHYQKEEHVLAAMLEKLQKSAVPEWHTPFGMQFRLRLLAQRVRERWVFVCLALGLAIFSITLLTSGKFDAPKTVHYVLCGIDAPDSTAHSKDCKPDEKDSSVRKVVEVGERTVMLLRTNFGHALPASLWHWLFALLASLPAVVGLWRGWQAFSQKSSILLKGVNGLFGLHTAEKQTNFRATFADEFKQVTHALGKRRLVIFIDDLDRCKPETVMEIMEAINFLSVSGECFIVFGIDVKKVAHAIGLAQSKLALQLRPKLPPDEAMLEYGTQYLLKMANFQIPVGRVKTSLALQLMVDNNEVNLDVNEKGTEPALDDEQRQQKLRQDEALKEKLRKLRALLSAIRRGCLILFISCAFGGFVWSASWLGQQLHTPIIPEKIVSKEEVKPSAQPKFFSEFTAGELRQFEGIRRALNNFDKASAPSIPVASTTATTKERLSYVLRPALKPETPRSLFAAIALIALLCLFLALKGIGKLVQAPEKDSQSFIKACRTWAPVISELFIAPREIKRWINRARYLSARLRIVTDAPQFWQRVHQQLQGGNNVAFWRPYFALTKVSLTSAPQASEQRLFTEEQILALAAILSVVAFFDDCQAMPGRIDFANCESFAEMIGNLPAGLMEADPRERQLHYLKVKAAIDKCMQSEAVRALNISSEAITAFVALCEEFTISDLPNAG